MSKIDSLIQELLLKKKKIDYLSYIKDLLEGDKACLDFVEVKKEVLDKLIPAVDSLALEIESGVQFVDSRKDSLTSDQVKVLSVLADRVQAKNDLPAPPQSSPFTNSVASSIPKTQELSVQQKAAFARDNRHLANKNVRASNGRSGLVVALDAPFVVIRSEAGVPEKVPLEGLEVL